MHDLIQPDRGQDATAIHLVTKGGYEDFAKGLAAGQRASLSAQKFEGAAGQVGIVPDGDGFFAVGGVTDPDALTSYCLAALAERLPEGTYRLQERQPGAAMFGWLTAHYRFTRYKEDEHPTGPRVLLTEQVGRLPGILAEAEAEVWVRDLVNTPAEDMGPAALEAECERLAKAHKATLSVTKGDALEQGYPMVHAVGRAADRKHAPRLLHLEWGSKDDPVLAIVGKGVCFDSGGLDIKLQAIDDDDPQKRNEADEEGHGRCGACAGTGRSGDDSGPEGAPSPADPGGRKRDFGSVFPPRRCVVQPQGADG